MHLCVGTGISITQSKDGKRMDASAQMLQLLGIDVPSLPIIRDADFLYGPRTDSGEDTYVLREINVSSVYPLPEHASAEIARLALDRVLAAKAARRNDLGTQAAVDRSEIDHQQHSREP
jgi:hypothetical protein